jgi:uncharacterized protein
MRKHQLALVIILILICSCSSSISYIEINGEKITVEIADTKSKRETGLMFRESLCDICGMLFVFEKEGLHSFWMKNTLIPLDIVFINNSMNVVDLKHAIPCNKDVCESYIPKSSALYVLEVNGNKFDEKIIGKKVEIVNLGK